MTSWPKKARKLLRVPKAELSDEEKAALSACCWLLLRRGIDKVKGAVFTDPSCFARPNPPVGRYQTVTGTVQTLDPVQKTLRLVLDSTTGGPGVQKKKALVISLGDIEALT